MEEKPTAHEQRQRWVIKSEQYKLAAEWLEHLALAVTASVVFQKVVAGASLRDPVVLVGSMCALVVYAAAVNLLLRI
jgi:hypothetical protein